MSNTSDTRSIYEIFRACRLCGAGGGYKMPIIQSVIPFDCPDIELREKIRECLQIEVKANDKMPPLICELCVDKLNDFYEFLDMCRQTNKKTRLRLGLPPQTMPQGSPDDCILGVTETVFSNDEDRPNPQRSKPCPKSKKNAIVVKKEDPKIETPKGQKKKEIHASMGRRLAKELADLNISDVNFKTETPRSTRSRESTVYVDSRSPSVSGRSSPQPARETRKTAPTNWIDTPRPTRGRIDSLSSNSSSRDSRKPAKEDNMSLGKIKLQMDTPRPKHGRIDSPSPIRSSRETRQTAKDKDDTNKVLNVSLVKINLQMDTPPAKRGRIDSPSPIRSSRETRQSVKDKDDTNKVLNVSLVKINLQMDTPPAKRGRIDSPSPIRSSRETRQSAKDKDDTNKVLNVSLEKMKPQMDPPPHSRDRIDSPSPNRISRETRQSAKDKDDTEKILNVSLVKINLQEQKKKQEQQKQTPNKSVLKKGKDDTKTEAQSDSDDEALSTAKGKRGRDRPGPKSSKEVPQKKIKLTIKLPPAPTVPTLAPNECPACGHVAGTSQGHSNHMKLHKVLYTRPELACDPCGQWFSSPQEAEQHHKKHAKYKCRHCKRDYKLLTSYYEHFAKVNCSPFEAVPDVKCPSCWQEFPTETLRRQHKCPGAGSRPGGECKTCHKTYATQKTLKKHQQNCTSKPKETKPAARTETKPEASKKSEVRVDMKIRSRLMKAEIRVAKVDPLLKKRKTKGGRYDVENVPHDYGLDRSRTYPYKYSGARVKPEPLCFDGMVSINKEIQRELYREEDYVHWDSDLSSDSENEVEEFGEKRRKLPTLTALTLKTIFSKQCLGKVPRKLRKVKQDKLFDSLFNTTADDDLSSNINSIIDDLNKEDKSSVNLLNIMNYDSDSVLDNDKSLLGGDEVNAVATDGNQDKKDIDIEVNNKNYVESKNDLNVDYETDASMNDLKDDQNNEVAKTPCYDSKTDNAVNNVDKDNVESDRTDAELSSQDGDSQNDKLIPTVNNTEENSCEINDANKESKGNENQEINNENSESKQNEESNKQNGETKNVDFSNGVTEKSDNFDSEIDDNKLMDALNAQIGESEKDIGNACSNFSIDNLIEKPITQSFGLGSLGDEEFL